MMVCKRCGWGGGLVREGSRGYYPFIEGLFSAGRAVVKNIRRVEFYYKATRVLAAVIELGIIKELPLQLTPTD